tara:strand:- start:10 stop:573 length:564 start_codon:yes stop_codon:yes gene_type:complete
MDLKNLETEINKFGKYVVQQARTNLTKKKHNATKELYNSIGYFVKKNSQGFNITFDMEDYGMYQDRGVKGVKSNYLVNRGSPFSYKASSNLIGLERATANGAGLGVFGRFAKRMNLQPRDKKGQFGTYKTMGYILAHSIKNKGIKASMFFTRPFVKAFLRYPQEVTEAYVLDLIEDIKKIDDYKKKL